MATRRPARDESPDHGAEQRLAAWLFEQRNGRREKSRPRWVAVSAVIACVAVVALIAGVVAFRPDSSRPTPSALADDTSMFITIGGSTDTGLVVQVRDSSGRLARSLPRVKAGDLVSVAQAPDATAVLAVVHANATTCTTELDRVDLHTGHSTLIRQINDVARGIALSPDGTRLAYLAYPTCPTQPNFCGVDCFGGASFLPNVLAVVNLRSGNTVRTATSNRGHPFTAVSWSPQGDQVVVSYDGPNEPILLILDADHPDFGSAAHVPSPANCGYFAASWSTAGIVAVKGCGENPELSATTLVRLDADGRASATWPLPKCNDTVATRADPTRHTVFIQSDIGYGNGTCVNTSRIVISQVTGQSQTRTVLDQSADDGIVLNG